MSNSEEKKACKILPFVRPISKLSARSHSSSQKLDALMAHCDAVCNDPDLSEAEVKEALSNFIFDGLR
jgi:hypothetical protein